MFLTSTAADFTLALSGVTANATVTVGNAGDSDASTYTVTVDTIAGDGTLGLDIAGGNDIVDTLNNTLDTTPTTDEVYTIDNTDPDGFDHARRRQPDQRHVGRLQCRLQPGRDGCRRDRLSHWPSPA